MSEQSFILSLPPPQLYEVIANSEEEARAILIKEWHRQNMRPILREVPNNGIVGFSTYDDLLRPNSLGELSRCIPNNPDFKEENTNV